MEHTIALQSISRTWMEAIQQSTEIKEYCKTHYGREPKFLLGGNPRESPSEEDCPFIVVMNGSKVEGEGIDTLTYSVAVVWVVSNSDMIVDGKRRPFAGYGDAKSIELQGAIECDEFGQLLYETVQRCAEDHGYPISKIEYDISPKAAFPQFPGVFIAETEIEPAMGEILTY